MSTSTRSARVLPAVVALAVAGGAVAAPAGVQRDSKGRWMGVLDEHPAIAYGTRPTDDPIATLNRKLETGNVTLTFEPGSGYLRSVLGALDVPVASQMLVLSRSGVQRTVTNPANPRALFYNEQVAVGFIRRAPFLEFIAHDAVQGAVFYTLDQRPADRPAFSRQSGCISCHVASATLEVPGFMTRSLAAGPDGTLKLRLGSQDIVEHRTPFERRWGGWFVTGSHGRSTHLGNTVVEAGDVRRSLVPAGAQNAASLAGAVDLVDYPAATSDVVALAVFDHQTRALNLLTRLGWEARVAAHEGGTPLATPAVTTTLADLVDYLLFVDEASMPGGLGGSSGFTEWFSARGPTDRKGRTLHALDLTTRLLRYPLSYTIDSPAFGALADDLRAEVYKGLARVLVDGDASAKDGHLSAADRRAIVEILCDTKPDARPFFPASR
ncbi:MAG: hypothetical protein KA371_03910 [Acidobacteria bacterium]|nr:hypothetical protein [Acidobacteriota bacterium]